MTYEYVCEACGHLWEAEQSIKDSALKKCVSCGADKAKRLVSGGTGFLLKGGGWYADLYGSPGASKKAAGAEGAKAAEGSTAAKADSADTKVATDGKSSSEAKTGTSDSKASGGGTPAAATPAAKAG